MMARHGVTKLAAFRHPLEQLDGVGAKVLEVVMNEIEPKNRRYGYYYHLYYSKAAQETGDDGEKIKNNSARSPFVTQNNLSCERLPHS